MESQSKYLVELFHAKLSVEVPAKPPLLPTPAGMALTTIAEFELVATVLNRAYRSPSMSFIQFTSSNDSLL